MGKKFIHEKFNGIIRKWILLSIVCFVLITLIPFTLNSYDVSRKQSIQQMEQLITIEQAYVDNWISEKLKTISSYSSMLSGDELQGPSPSLSSPSLMSGGIKGSGIFDRYGDVLACSFPGCPANASGTAFFNHAKAGTWYSDELEVNPVTGERIMTVSSPITSENGMFAGVVAAKVSFIHIDLMMEKFDSESMFTINLVNESGNWVAGSSSSLAAYTPSIFHMLRSGGSGIHNYTDGLGRNMTGSFQKIGDKPFYLVAGMESSNMYFLYRGFLFNLLSLCIGLISLLVLSTLLWNRFRKPLQIFTEGTEKMLRGNYDYQIRQETINYLPSDLKQPIESFKKMVSSYKTNIRSLEQLASITSNIGFGLSVFDGFGNCKYMNPEALRMLGWHAGEEVNKRFNDFVKQRTLTVTTAADSEPFHPAPYTTEALLQRKDGTDFPVSLSVNPIDNDSRNDGYVIVFRDITEEKRIEELLLRSEKLSVVGQLAAGLAHEIRNPLTSVKGFLQLLQSGSQPVNLNNYTGIMLTELTRIEMIVSEFIILSKPHMMKVTAADLTLLMQSALTTLETTAADHHVRFDTDFPASTTLFPCEIQQMQHAFIHLIENGIEAMPLGGTLTIRMKELPDSLSIQIGDEGPGIEQAHLAKLGEPFYTTKSDGIGLGLMVSIKIIEMHRGIVDIVSEVGKGTNVHIKLPFPSVVA
ncbi:ATP-binding protein [Paenibacillus sp. MBLB4367]|uniref:ATP-binding protein n=1 Tax=Paenibacillus sp. MBLB4367 TaxID=3384767 RepID=UPI003908183A